jgi:hypothetical protein
MAKGRDGRIAHLKIFAHGIVFGDICLDFVAHSFVNRALSGNRRLAGSFRTPPGFFNFAPPPGTHAAHFSSTLALAELVTRPFLEFGEISSLFASISLAFGALFSLG